MSNSELLRIKNKQKTPYKKQKTASSYKNDIKRPNDRFGFISSEAPISTFPNKD